MTKKKCGVCNKWFEKNTRNSPILEQLQEVFPEKNIEIQPSYICNSCDIAFRRNLGSDGDRVSVVKQKNCMSNERMIPHIPFYHLPKFQTIQNFSVLSRIFLIHSTARKNLKLKKNAEKYVKL